MRRPNYMLRFWLLLVVVTIALVALYYLPKEPWGLKTKKVDILSELRITTGHDWSDSLQHPTDFMSTRISAQADSLLFVERRDSIYSAVKQADARADSLITFEDYSPGHNGINKLFVALSKGKSLGRPVRIAVLGDSFIEGDIFTADIRRMLQTEFGGSGVGWMPITSEVAGFRQTIKHSFTGWKTHSILKPVGKQGFTISGFCYVPTTNARVSYKLPGAAARCITFYYKAEEPTSATLQVDGDSLHHISLPTSDNHQMQRYAWQGSTKTVDLCIKGTPGFVAYGVSLEGDAGIVVDNFSLRGNSGLPLGNIDGGTSHRFDQLRPYDLIILQYGLNVAENGRTNYDAYYKQMLKVVARLKDCLPSANLMIMGVSDRAGQSGGTIKTLAAVPALAAAQQRVARESGIVFWNTFLAMGGEGSMVSFVQRGMAAKDYTHLSFAGGRVVAKAFVNALLFEKKFYDAAH